MNGVYMIEFWVFTFVITGNCLFVCVTVAKLKYSLPCIYCVAGFTCYACVCFFPPFLSLCEKMQGQCDCF